jgi:hypothetical protein
VRAFAFLAEGAVAPLAGFAWPTPKGDRDGPWVDTDTAPSEALRGCRIGDLPYWLDDELWSIELDGALEERDHVVLAERARLLGRIETWSDPLAWEFTDACARRAADRAADALRDEGRVEAAASLDEARDLEALEQAASAAAGSSPAGMLAGYASDVCFYALDAGVPPRAACVAAKMTAFALAGDVNDVAGHDERLANERAWQAAWLADRLGLSANS